MGNKIIEKLELDLTKYINMEYIMKNNKTIEFLEIDNIKISKYLKKALKEIDKELNGEYNGILESWLIKSEQRLNGRLRVTKKRWFDSVIKNNESPLYLEYNYAKYQYKVMKKSEFKNEFKCSNPEEYRDVLISQVQNWRENKEVLLIDFPYLKTQSKRMHTTAFRTDIDVFIFNYIYQYEKKNSGNYKDVISKPLILLDIPSKFGRNQKMKQLKMEDINSLTKGAKSSDPTSQLLNEIFTGDIYEIGDKTGIVSFIDKEGKEEYIKKKEDKVIAIQMDNIDKIATTITDSDVRVFSTMLDYIDAHFFRDRTISFTLYRLAKDMYGDNINGRTYKDIVKSLNKLFMIKFRLYTSTDDMDRYTSFGILDYLDIINNKKENRVDVKVSVSLPISDQIVEEKVIKVFREPLDALENSYAKNLIFKLQADRIVFLSLDEVVECAAMGKKGEYRRLDMEFFEGIVYMNKNYRYRNVTLIEDALEDLRKNNLVVDEHHREGYSFYIKYLPITEKESEKLLTGKNNKAFSEKNYREIEESISKYHR